MGEILYICTVIAHFLNMLPENPMVTVVVTTYNHVNYIKDCLEGVLAQECSFPVHVLVVDDLSTDGTREIVADYGRRYPDRVEAVLNPENLWSKRTLYTKAIVPRIKGRYVAYCEGDDFWTFPGKLQRQVDYLEAHPDCTGCFHLFDVANEAGMKHPFVARMKTDRKVSARELLFEHLGQLSTFVIKSEFYKSVANYIGQPIYDLIYPNLDMLLYGQLALSGSVYGIARKWSVYRIHSGGVFSAGKLSESETQSHYRSERTFTQAFYPANSVMLKWMDLYERLERWTLKRRASNLPGALSELFAAAIYHPGRFFRLYFNRYLR